ncbi:35395_t:CDS:2, partial [Gigaspora margarita]
MDYNEEQTDANNEPSLEDMFNDSITLLIGEIFDLETEENSESFTINTVQADSLDNLDYDPCDIEENYRLGEIPANYQEKVQIYQQKLLEKIIEYDEKLGEKYLNGEKLAWFYPVQDCLCIE